MAARQNPRPYFWKVDVRWKGKPEVLHPIPDKIFALERLDPPGGKKCLFLEFDTGSQPVVRPDLSKSSILRKLIAYGETYRRDLHTATYGFPNMRVLFVTSSGQRIDNMIEAHQRHTKHLCSPKRFVFADQAELLGAADFFQYPWLDAEGGPHRLLD